MHCTETYHRQQQFSHVGHHIPRIPLDNINVRYNSLETTNGPNSNSVISTEKPKYSRFAIKTVRISSFRTFPENHSQTATQLAEAGFFYSGKDDEVFCFFCGQGLRSWDPEDEPWIEHVRWSPQCRYIRDVKGIEFINSVQEALSNPDFMDVLVRSLREDTNQRRGHGDTTDFYRTNQVERIPTDYLLETMAAQSVMNTGYSRASVVKAINIYLKRTGSTNFKGEDLMSIILDLEDGLLKYEDIVTTCDTMKISENIDVHNPRSTDNHQLSDIETDGETSLDLDFLKNENTKLKERTLCRHCKVKTVSVVFLPCGHLCCCLTCAPDLDHCPKCNHFIKATVKTYLT